MNPATQATPEPAQRPLFSLGEIAATLGALQLLQAHNLHPIRFLARHLHGDWGEVGAEDARANEQALRYGTRLLSVYPLPGGETLWVITEADRSVTTLLLPDEY